MQIEFTHKGWFGLCPVYFAQMDTCAPVVDVRHWMLEPLMLLNEAMYWLVFRCAEAMSPDFEASWPLAVTGELQPPVMREIGPRVED